MHCSLFYFMHHITHPFIFFFLFWGSRSRSETGLIVLWLKQPRCRLLWSRGDEEDSRGCRPSARLALILLSWAVCGVRSSLPSLTLWFLLLRLYCLYKLLVLRIRDTQWKKPLHRRHAYAWLHRDAFTDTGIYWSPKKRSRSDWKTIQICARDKHSACFHV